MKINACIVKHLAEQYLLNSGKYAEKLKHIADKNFQTNCNKNDAAENIRLVGKSGSEAFSKGKSGHADKECDYGNDQGTDKSHQPVILRDGESYGQGVNGSCNALNEKGLGTNSRNFITLIGSPDTIDQHGATNIAKKDQRDPWNKFLKCPEVFYNGVDT